MILYKTSSSSLNVEFIFHVFISLSNYECKFCQTDNFLTLFKFPYEYIHIYVLCSIILGTYVSTYSSLVIGGKKYMKSKYMKTLPSMLQ